MSPTDGDGFTGSGACKLAIADPPSELAERRRRVAPERRYRQVAPHRLQVTVPAIGAERGVQRSA